MVILFTAHAISCSNQKLQGGGLEVYLFRVTRMLKEMGHTPIIVSYGDKEAHTVENGIEIFWINTPKAQLKVGGKKLRLLYERMRQSWALNCKITELVKSRKVDLIQFTSLRAPALCYFGHTPAVMRLSSYSRIYNNHEEFEQVKIDIWGLCERLSAKRCNAVFAPSNVVADSFSHDIHRAVFVIESPFCIEYAAYDENVYQEMLSGKKYCLFFGRMVADKGVLVLAECLRQFLQSNSEHYFVCCGSDDYINGRKSVSIMRKAAGQYRERFLYIPMLSHETLYPIIKHADFVVCPSWIENLSNSCIEAMYFERVVIGTDGASYEQLIDDGTSGLLCMPGDSKSLLAKMNEAVSMTATQKLEMGKRAKERIEKLAPEYTVKKLLRYYRYVIDRCSK